MTITAVLIAHGSAARLLEVQKNGEDITLIKDFFHPETRKKDLPREEGEPLRHLVDYSANIEEHERRVFAKEIGLFITRLHDQKRFNRLIVVATKKLLGELRDELPNHVKTSITHELTKDLLPQRLSDREMINKIKEDLDLVCF